ncbi:T9SS type A sorting domain-containing protein [Taibaiella koreensis]|uniref:T9SS type A sorting domain-containing protein n=1 Tax=Taibaiella koreensis TaxID=1268548 RepID=UPI0013C2E4FC|nr:T9SS type A sorting domain-containing protein [Taibaiella koreensis]
MHTRLPKPGGTNQRKPLLTRKGAWALFAFHAALMTAPYAGMAQFTDATTFIMNNNDVKHYVLDKLPKTGICITAGTIFYPGGDHGIQLKVIQNYPGMPPLTMVNREFNNSGFDERPIGVHFINDKRDQVVIVASRRNMTQPEPDKIEILVSGDGGDHIASQVIVADAGANDCLYPMSTAISGSTLYICGYSAEPNALWPNEPDNFTPKKVFVLKYSLEDQVVVASRLLDYVPPTGVVYDFDMATRIKLLDNDRLFITGSCNAYNSLLMPQLLANEPQSAGMYCATLSLMMDKDLNLLSDKPFSEFNYFGGSNGHAEYGTDIWEDVSGTGFFIFGNTRYAFPNNVPFDMRFYTITHVDPNMDVDQLNRYRGPDFDNGWSVNIVETDKSDEVILSGFQSGRPYGPSQYPTNTANINPFLTRIAPRYNGDSIIIDTKWFSTIFSAEGTGDANIYTNNYLGLGSYFSSIAHTPVNAITDLSTGSNDVILTAPIWNSNANKLNMKLARMDDNGDMAKCPYYKDHIPQHILYSVYESEKGQSLPSDLVASATGNPTEDDIVLKTASCIDKVFKPTGIVSGNKTAPAISLHPNPAQDYIQFEANVADGQSTITLTLTDVSGRTVAALYSGKADGLVNRKLYLPKLAKGVYGLSYRISNGTSGVKKLVIR